MTRDRNKRVPQAVAGEIVWATPLPPAGAIFLWGDPPAADARREYWRLVRGLAAAFEKEPTPERSVAVLCNE